MVSVEYIKIEPATENVYYNGQADDRVFTAVIPVSVSRFRPRYRGLSVEEKALHDAIKDKAAELEILFDKVRPGRYSSLAMTSLEQSVMWIIKELTS